MSKPPKHVDEVESRPGPGSARYAFHSADRRTMADVSILQDGPNIQRLIRHEDDAAANNDSHWGHGHQLRSYFPNEKRDLSTNSRTSIAHNP
jgi:hypothetical protein